LIPAFNEHGVLPPGRYPTDVVEVEQRFVGSFPLSATRKAIYDGWRTRRNELFSLVEVEFEWIDGSFVTGKRDAGDLDVVTFVRSDHLTALTPADSARVAQLTFGAHPRLAFGCDSYLAVIFDEAHPAHSTYLQARGYWDRWWARDRVAPEKGYLDVRGAA